MAKSTLRSKDLRKLGYTDDQAISLALDTIKRHFKRLGKEQALALLQAILQDPAAHFGDEKTAPLAQRLAPAPTEQTPLSGNKRSFAVYGAEQIGREAFHQMHLAMKLPVSVAGALMPDAHAGYGLPIGGVLATDNAVIPYGVGVDIGCRMCLTVYDLPGTVADSERIRLKKLLLENTEFGAGGVFPGNKWQDHPILERPEFGELPILKGLHKTAFQQLGTSGSGNHFVEFGVAEIAETHPALPLPPGRYLALLSHSGSRGLGAKVAGYFTRLAMKQSHLPDHVRHLAWLALDTDAGREYWAAMQLAGDYATACHDRIHQRIAKALGQRPLAKVENHHNFAWKELHEGRELIVHRKGATPAGAGVAGIIPGSMTAPGYIVAGRGTAAALQSASHGAGRLLTRGDAKRNITPHMVREVLADAGVTLLGGNVDEAPQAYKDIHAVLAAQQELVDIIARFQPKIVRMDGGNSHEG